MSRSTGQRHPPPPAPWHPPLWLAALLLALAVTAIYWPAVNHGFVNYDDDRYLTANATVQKGLTWDNFSWAFTHPVADNWHPVTVLSNMLICQFWQLTPWPHHLANVLLHAANAALVLILLQRLTGTFWKSLIVAVLFAVHPLRVESVAWVAERKDVLSGFFGLLTLIAYSKYARTKATDRPRGFLASPAYWLAWLWLGLGLMTKPMLVTWPFVLLLLDYWPLERRKSGRTGALLLEKIPFLALAVAASVAAFTVQQHAGVVGTMNELPPVTRIETALIAYVGYLGKTLWPANLGVFYPHPGHWPTAEAILAALLLAVLSAAIIVVRRKRPYLMIGWLWFLGTLVPVIGLVQVGLQAMADRYTYLPSLGIFIAAVWGVASFTKRQSARLALAGGAAASAIACVAVTEIQLGYWQDGETLFRHTVAVTKDNYMALYNLAAALDEKQRPQEAIPIYETVISIHPTFAGAHLSLGTDLDKIGHLDAAVRSYEEAIRLAPANAQAHNNLGVAWFKLGKHEEAIREFREAVHLQPDNASPHNSLAAALYNDGQIEEGLRQFREALRLGPDVAEVHYNFACVLNQQGQTNDAAAEFKEALRLNPDYVQAQQALANLSSTAVKSR